MSFGIKAASVGCFRTHFDEIVGFKFVYACKVKMWFGSQVEYRCSFVC